MLIMIFWILMFATISIFVLVQSIRGKKMTPRELGFFVLGLIYTGIPLVWLINQV